MPGHSRLVEHVYFNPLPPQEADSWWERYQAQLVGFTDTARASVEADSRYILQFGILAADTTKPEEWSSSRSRTGLVMGSVQSGKTASMLGVSALAIDNGIDIIVVIAGTRLSLWRQTYERLVQQLDAGEENAQKFKRRLLCPVPGIALSEQAYSLKTTYLLPSAQVRQRLSQGRPLIIVAMKQTDHLHALAASLRDNVFKAVKELGRPVHMLVLDDEADDGSVLDAIVESSQDPFTAD